MITRKFGKILRGTATPFQLFTGCLLAAVLGFMPGFAQAPGLLVVGILLLIILNANLAMAGLVAITVKLLSLAMAPVSFALGRWMIDGPMQPFMKTLINAPVFALFGFDYYLTTGGLVMGLVTGVIIGYLVVRLIGSFRKKMSALESGSERFQKFTAKKWVRLMTFVFVGGSKGKKSYDDILSKRVGNPIRPIGVVFAAVTIALLFIIQMFFSGPIVHMALQRGLERANGATVDLKETELNLRENTLVLTGLAIADPEALDTDIFRADRLEANLSGMSLLKKQLQLDKVTISNAAQGETRERPGKRIGKAPEPAPPEPPATGERSIDDYLKNAREWKERLAQIKRWMEKLSGPESEETPGDTAEKEETLSERLAREIALLGYANVRATHLIDGAPTVTINELVADKVRVAALPGETLTIHATNLSTHPKLLGKEPAISVDSSKGTLGLDMALASFTATKAPNRLEFFYKGLPTDTVAGQLSLGDTQPLSGGTIDIEAKGKWSSLAGVTVDLPLMATLNNTTLSIPGGQPTKVEKFNLPIGIRGPLDNPRIQVDDKQLANALVQAGISQAKTALTEKAKETLNKELGDKVGGELGDKVGEQGKSLINSILGGKKKDQ